MNRTGRLPSAGRRPMKGLVSLRLGSEGSDDALGGTSSWASQLEQTRMRLNEEERLERLASMDPDALRAIAASMPIIEQAKAS